MKLTLKQLRKAGEEINELFGNEAIDLTLNEVESTKLLIQALDLIDMDADKESLTVETISVLEEIQQAQKKPVKRVPKPEKQVNIDTTEEDDEDINTDNISDVEETEEDANIPVEIEEPEILPLKQQINEAKKLATLHAIIDANKEFKKLAKVKDKFKTLMVLKKAMLDTLEEEEPAKPAKESKKNEKKADKKVEEKESAKEEKPDKKAAVKEKNAVKKELKSNLTAQKKEKISKTGHRTKKAVIIEMLARAEGATIEEMAQKMVDEGIDEDYEKNCTVTKLWLNKMGVDCKKSTLKANPRLKAIIK